MSSVLKKKSGLIGKDKENNIKAFFDGEVFRLKEPVSLECNRNYLITVRQVEENSDSVESDPAFDISSLSVKTGISDLASEHDFYLSGTPKRAGGKIKHDK